MVKWWLICAINGWYYGSKIKFLSISVGIGVVVCFLVYLNSWKYATIRFSWKLRLKVPGRSKNGPKKSRFCVKGLNFGPNPKFCIVAPVWGTSGYLRYFWVLWGASDYFKILLGTSGYFEVLLVTLRYFLATSGPIQYWSWPNQKCTRKKRTRLTILPFCVFYSC